jgi:hypothetical protein
MQHSGFRKVAIAGLALLSMAVFSCHKVGGPEPSPPAGDTSVAGTDEVPPVDNSVPSVTVSWDATARKISHPVGYAEYGRIHRINGDTLLLTYHCGPDKLNFFGVDIALRRSVDNGGSWSAPDIITDGPLFNYYGFQNPEIVVLANGWILLSYVGRGKPDDNAHDNVQVTISRDRGHTWGASKIVAPGRSWEPGMVQLPDGTIDLFYSSEAAWFPGSDVQQEILLSTSSDNGLSWTAPKRVSYSPGNRDGMAVPLVLQDHKGIVFSIESVGNNKSPWIVWSSLKANFDYPVYATTQNSRRWAADAANFFGGAPFLIQLPTGETVLSVQYRGGRAIGPDWKKGTVAVFIGNAMATKFTHGTYPWPNLPIDEGAYFNSLFLKDDSTLVLVTTRNFPDGHSEIWWKQGHLHR